MRSVLLAATFPPTRGGIETLLYQTSRRMLEPPLVVAPLPAAADDMVVQAVRISLGQRAAYRPLWALHPALHYLHAFWQPTLRAIGSWRPRMLLAGHVYLAPLASLLARALEVPFAVFVYGQEVWRGGRPVGRAMLDRRLRGGALRAANRVFVPGTFTAELVRADWQVADAQIVVVPYGAEPHPERLSEGDEKRLLTVARLIPRKGIDTVISALPNLPLDVTYHVVGGGPDEHRLRALAEGNGVADRVRFLGRVDDATLADEYRRCSVFVLPTRRTADGELEGYGLVHFEAAAWGKPVVAGRSGGEVDAVVDNETGVLVDGTSTEQVCLAIRGLLADPVRRTRLGAAGRARVEQSHNWTNAAAVVDSTLAEFG